MSIFSNLSESHFSNERKVGLLGYYSMINAIKKISNEKSVEIYNIKLLDELMRCIIKSLNDSDNKIILLAAQCMYNIMVYFNLYALLNFNDFFDCLLRLVIIDEKEIKDCAENLDSSLKGIINYSFQGKLPQEFNLLNFFKKIILSINLENHACKFLILTWIRFINQIPTIKFINILYLFLSELFDMLQIKEQNISDITNECLDNFYNEIETFFDDIPYSIKIKIFEVVIDKCQNNNQNEEIVKLIAFKWVNLFSKQYKYLFMRIRNVHEKNLLKKKVSNNLNMDNSDNIIMMSSNEDKEKKKDDDDTNESDSSVVEDDNQIFPFDLLTKLLKIIFNTLKDEKNLKDIILVENKTINNDINNINKSKENTGQDLYTIINNINNCLLSIIDYYNMNQDNIKELEQILMDYLIFENNDVLLSVLNWVEKFFAKYGDGAFSKDFNKFIEKYSFIVTYKDEEIFETGIQTLCKIEKCRKGSFNIIIHNIVNKLEEKDNIFAVKRAKEFVTVLCRELNDKLVYNSFADVLSQMNISNFVCKIINILNMLLLTLNDTEELRNLLKNIQKTTNIEEKLFFKKLFKVWCINPVSCLILCLIAEDFELSYHLLNRFGKIKLGKESYLEYAQLVQVLESKEFISKYIYRINI